MSEISLTNLQSSNTNGDGTEAGDNNTEEYYPQTPNPSSRVTEIPSSNSTAGTCFFADATLDIEEARGMADVTPEVTSHSKMIFDNGNSSDDSEGRSQHEGGTIGGHRAESVSSLLGLPNLQNQSKHHNGNNNAPGSNTVEENSRKIDRGVKQITSSSINNPYNLPTYRPRTPRYPRDIAWTVALVLILTIFLILPVKVPHNHTSSYPMPSSNDTMDITTTNIENWTASLSNNTTLLFNTVTIFLLSTLLLARTFYLSHGGGDGDDARYKAGNLLIVASSVTWLPFGILGLQVYWLEAHDDNGDGKLEGKALLRSITLGLFAVAFWELFVFSNWIYDASGQTSVATSSSASPSRGRDDRHGGGGGLSVRAMIMMGSTTNRLWNGRKMAFFRELASTSLDILSRSLRCQSFYRVVCGLVGMQFLLVWMWRNALLRVMRKTSRANEGWVTGTLMIAICVVGWWVTSVVRRVLGLIASGGITSWFAQQSLLLEKMEMMKMENKIPSDIGNGSTIDDNSGGQGGDGGGNTLHSTMPEAYRVDASAYRSPIEFDEGVDDDYEDDADFNAGNVSRIDAFDSGRVTNSNYLYVDASSRATKATDFNTHSDRSGRTKWTGGGSGGASTVKAFLISAVTVSLGSVAKCALMGGLAQIIWWLRHKVDKIKRLSTRFASRRSSGFQGMAVGGPGGGDTRGSERLWEQLMGVYRWLDTATRLFVRNNSELALCHVAAYFKSYRRAANDVMALIDASGVEPMLHEDLSSHMCSAISKSITATLTVLSAQILVLRRTEEESDVLICETMIVSYIMCYTILFTIMEPLRASIVAVYVCFAQHPQSLSQAFPLVFHRLSRISEDNNIV